MSTETVRVINTQTGQTGSVPRRVFNHPVLSGGSLVEVEHDMKPYAPELYRPRTTEEFSADYPDRVVTSEVYDDVTDTITDYDPEESE